jgi:Fur family transcriptional regulator, ferric uptake regulator
MRLLVLEFLIRHKEALSLSDLEHHFTRSDRTTLYRTLKTFHEKGVVHEIHDDSGNTKYALCSEDCNCSYPNDMHPHFYCSECETTLCLSDLAIPPVELPGNFLPASVNFVINGTCSSCAS